MGYLLRIKLCQLTIEISYLPKYNINLLNSVDQFTKISCCNPSAVRRPRFPKLARVMCRSYPSQTASLICTSYVSPTSNRWIVHIKVRHIKSYLHIHLFQENIMSANIYLDMRIRIIIFKYYRH